MTDLIERIQALEAKDGDVLVLTAQRKLTMAERDALNIQMITLSGLFLGRGKDVSTIVLDNGLDLKLVRTSELKAEAPEGPQIQWSVQEFKIWKGIKPDKPTWANLNLCSFSWEETNGIMEYLAGNNPEGVYRVTSGPFDPSPQIKTGLRMGDLLLHAFYEGGKRIRRASWPVGDHIDADGAEGGTIWYYDADDDELVAGWTLTYHDLCAGDWEILE